MPEITTSDGVKLYYEEAGQGDPIVFVHEFGGHHLSWETQMRHFSRRYRMLHLSGAGLAAVRRAAQRREPIARRAPPTTSPT